MRKPETIENKIDKDEYLYVKDLKDIYSFKIKTRDYKDEEEKKHLYDIVYNLNEKIFEYEQVEAYNKLAKGECHYGFSDFCSKTFVQTPNHYFQNGNICHSCARSI